MPWWIVENTLLAAILALLVALVTRARRVPPVVRHGLWLVVLIKLIVPPVFSLGITVPVRSLARQPRQQAMHEIFEIASREASVEPPADLRPPLAWSTAIDVFPEDEPEMSNSSPLEAFVLVDDPQPAMMETESLQALPTELANAGEHSTAPADSQTIRPRGAEAPIARVALSFSLASLAKRLPWAALAGTLVVTFVQVVRLVRLRRMLNRALRAPQELRALVVDLSAQLGVRPPAVRLSSQIQSPLVCACGPAVLMWPASRLASLSDSARQAVIVHELAHLARRDHWIGWVELAASCAWWWNPLFWYVRHQLHENAELACDAWVTGLFPEARRVYARALVDLAELDSLETATVPALGVGDGSRKLFERRLVMIMGERVQYRMGVLGFIGMGVLALVALPGCSPGLVVAEDLDAEVPGLAGAPPALNVEATPSVAGLSEASDELGDPFNAPPATSDPERPLAETAPSLAAPAIEAPPDEKPAVLEERPRSADPREESRRGGLPGVIRYEIPAVASSDDRLKRLEDRFEALLAELRELKSSGKSRPGQANPLKATPQNLANPLLGHPAVDPRATASPKPTMFDLHTTDITKKLARRSDAAVDAVSLTRTTYKLPPGKADDVAAFLKDNLTDEIEVRVKDQMLIVTASAEDQTAIASFIRLLQTRGAPTKKADANDEFRGSNDAVPKRSRPTKATILDDKDDAFESRKPVVPQVGPAPTPRTGF